MYCGLDGIVFVGNREPSPCFSFPKEAMFPAKDMNHAVLIGL